MEHRKGDPPANDVAASASLAAAPGSGPALPASDEAARSSDDAAPSSERVASAADQDAPVRAPRRPRPVKVPEPRITRDELRAYLALKDTHARIRSIVVARVAENTPKHVIDEIASDAYTDALEARSLPRSTDTMRGWLGTVTARAVAHYFRRQTPHLAWLNREKDVEEEQGEPPEVAPGDDWLVSNWLSKVVVKDERDQETFELIVYKARHDKTDDQVAAEHLMSTTAFRNRVHRFKDKYAPRWRRRERMILLLWLAAAIAVVVGLAFLWRTLAPTPTEDWADPASRLSPSASASASAPPPPPAPPPSFNQALPPTEPPRK